MIKNLSTRGGNQFEEIESKATRAIKLDLLHFMEEDPQGWLYQAD